MLLKRLARVTIILLALTIGTSPVVAQPLRSDSGPADVAVVLRQLNSVGTFMMFTAHPDDENNSLLAKLAKGEGHRTVLLTATRGDGGQNEIGAELFDGLAVLRTEELLAAHRLDGAEQYFTRAVDFGYSFSIEETFARWGREEILGDMVRMIRTVRPEVMSAMSPSGQGGGQHHQASAVLAHEAYHAAADPDRFPEQIAEGLRVWQAHKFYFSAGFPFGFGFGPPGFRRAEPDPDLTAIDLGGYDALLGTTYAEIGSRARGMHKCQGMSQLVALPASSMGARFQLVESTDSTLFESEERSLFDGVDTSVQALASFAGSNPPVGLTQALDQIAGYSTAALDQYQQDGLSYARLPILNGLQAVRELRDSLAAMSLPEDAQWEIDFRLATKERQFVDAALLVHSLRIEVLASDGLIVPGQTMDVSVLIANRGSVPVAVRGVRTDGFTSAVACQTESILPGAVFSCAQSVTVPIDSRPTDIHWRHEPVADRYIVDEDVPFGAPFRPTSFRVNFEFDFGQGVSVAVDRPVEYRYSDDIFAGEKRTSLSVVPRFVVSMTPEIAIIPTDRDEDNEVRVTVINAGPDPTSGEVMLRLPSGWSATPETIPIRFSREDESQTVRFQVSTGGSQVGEYRVGAVVEDETEQYQRGFQLIEYPHIGRRHLGRIADGRFKVIDVSMVSDLSVGYVDGVGDAVPPAIEQLGASLEFVDSDDLAWGDLERFDVIVTGVRAYERRQDLRANNDRLLQYVENGGTVIVQYNKFEFNQAQYGPYPAQVSRNRVTDERAPIRILENDHPLFAWPNRIAAQTWDDWVQERGLYFLGDRDESYVDLVELEDSFEFNPGIKRGALVEARVGDGRWLYVGLGLWRQLPAGTPGAYALLANLLSLGQATEP
jgi:LmbE family N-acetylglucosaminyl deacetylase